MLSHSFSQATWAVGLGLAFTLLAGAVVALLFLARRRLAGWQRAFLVVALAPCLALAGLSFRDAATKVSELRLEPTAPRLELSTALGRRPLVLGPDELLGVGLVSLGASEERPGSRQIVLAARGRREIRTFLEDDVVAAEELAGAVAAAFGLELQRFSGPPPKR